MNECITTHKLDFEACDWPKDPNIKLFRIGTCEGQWFDDSIAYCIISVINHTPHNGHLEDVFQWFEHSCKRDNKLLKVLELMNNDFRKYLIEKRGFVPIPMTDHLIKLI